MRYVYLLYDDDGQLLYIGQTDYIQRRIHDHEMYHAWGHKIAKIGYIPLYTDDQNTSRALESLLIQTLEPRYNEQIYNTVKLTMEVFGVIYNTVAELEKSDNIDKYIKHYELKE